MTNDLDTESGLPKSFRRDHLYDDVIEVYQEDLDQLLRQFPFRVRYENERAVDTGGVCRDMFSAFWEECYLKNFDGERLLIPAVHPNTDMAVLRLLGTILAHGFMVCGFLTIRIALPILAATIFGPDVEISDKIIIDSFIDYLASYESSSISQALSEVGKSKELSPSMQAQLISILSRLGCVEVPTKKNLQKVILSTARHLFLGKTLGMLYTLHSGVPKPFRSFFETLSFNDFFTLYKALNATPKRVLQLVEEPGGMNSAQERVFSYLTTYISNCKQDELRLLLRFVTGSSVLLDKTIKVTFNRLSGLARRPISHTCDCLVELPLSYSTYPEFEQELSRVLACEASWAMDAI